MCTDFYLQLSDKSVPHNLLSGAQEFLTIISKYCNKYFVIIFGFCFRCPGSHE